MLEKKVIKSKYQWFPDIPLNLEEQYKLRDYAYEDVSGRIQKKYLNRALNLQRAWIRICSLLPETLSEGSNLDIIEFSTAHGAMLEIWRHFGHSVTGTDICLPVAPHRKHRPVDPSSAIFENSHSNPREPLRAGWVYQPIIESIGIKVDLFDAGIIPYSYEDNSFDYLCCYHAINSYAHPSEWIRIVDEFCRIARRAVVIGFNAVNLYDQRTGNEEETFNAWERLRTYNRCGFHCTSFELGHTGRGYHPTACKLIRSP